MGQALLQLLDLLFKLLLVLDNVQGAIDLVGLADLATPEGGLEADDGLAESEELGQPGVRPEVSLEGQGTVLPLGLDLNHPLLKVVVLGDLVHHLPESRHPLGLPPSSLNPSGCLGAPHALDLLLGQEGPAIELDGEGGLLHLDVVAAGLPAKVGLADVGCRVKDVSLEPVLLLGQDARPEEDLGPAHLELVVIETDGVAEGDAAEAETLKVAEVVAGEGHKD